MLKAFCLLFSGSEKALTLLHCQLNEPWHKGVLRGAIDKGDALQDGSCRVDARRCHLSLIAVDGRQEVFRRVI